MSLHHSFDIDYAAQYGIECAILIHHFEYWIRHNQQLKRNFHDGRTWMYQTQAEIAAHFPYMSEDTVHRHIKKLVEKGVLMKGNYNRTSFDRTVWYAFVNEEMFTKPRNRGIEERESRNPSSGIAEPIPYTKTDAETEEDSQTPKAAAPPPHLSPHSRRLSILLFDHIKEMNSKAKAPAWAKWDRDIDRLLRIDGYSPEEVEAVIAFVAQSEFWGTNILSPAKLRKQMTQLIAQMKQAKMREQKTTPQEQKARLAEQNQIAGRALVESRGLSARLNAVRFEDHAVRVKINNGYHFISYHEHGFLEQLENALRKGQWL